MDAEPSPPEPTRPPESAGPAPLRNPVRLALVVILSLGGGIVYGVHVRDTAMALHAWWSTVPWLIVAVHPRLAGRWNLLAFCAGLWLMALIGIEWLRGQGTATWLLAPWFYWPLVLPAWFLVRSVRSRWPAFPLALLWAITFTGTEWLRLRLSPGELALCVLGYSQIVLTRMVQVADLAGVAAVTFWLAALHGFLAETAIAATTPGGLARARRSLMLQGAGVALLLAGVFAYGTHRDTEAHFSAGPRLHVLQSNTARSPVEKEARNLFDLQVLQTLSTARQDSDAILWPENSISIPFGTRGGDTDAHFIGDLARIAAGLQQPILADGWRHAPDLGGDVHTSVLVLPDGSVQFYDKVRLLPWTEVVPGRALAGRFGDGTRRAWEGFIKRFVGVVPEGVAGPVDEMRPFTFTDRQGKTWTFGAPICFEIATARIVNRWHRLGVDFLVNQTSEGRLGDSIHEMTIAVSGFRAIEGRTSVVRATNDGISALIDPNGRPREILRGRYTGSPINEAGVFYPQVILDARAPTVYARIGDALAIACLLAALLLAIAAFVTRPRPAAAALADPASAAPPTLVVADATEAAPDAPDPAPPSS